jgi:hypothetical protein
VHSVVLSTLFGRAALNPDTLKRALPPEGHKQTLPLPSPYLISTMDEKGLSHGGEKAGPAVVAPAMAGETAEWRDNESFMTRSTESQCVLHVRQVLTYS